MIFDYIQTIFISVYDSIIEYSRSLYKFVLRAWTGECEITRICSYKQGYHGGEMTRLFARSLKKSKRLLMYSKIVFFLKPFNVSMVYNGIIEAKRIRADSNRFSQVSMINIKHSLQSIRLLNVSYQKIIFLKNTKFDYVVDAHSELLHLLWDLLMPNISRTPGDKFVDGEALGFQGKDPSTDFRGMGLLGLIQLVYFSQNHQKIAQNILADSMAPVYFPFAATGINITAFILELMEDFRLHAYFFEKSDKILLQSSTESEDGPSMEPQCIDESCSLFHEVFCGFFVDFMILWKRKKPRDLMAFPEIFKEVKSDYRKKYHRL